MDQKEFDLDLVAARIKDLRLEHQMTPMRFAASIGASTKAIVEHWESGRNAPSSYSLFQIAQTDGVSADWLLGLTDERRKHGDT